MGPWGESMDWSIGSPQTRSVVGVHGPGVSVFGLTLFSSYYLFPGSDFGFKLRYILNTDLDLLKSLAHFWKKICLD